MKVFLCGGGAGEQTVEANKRLNEVIDHTKPCLYIPLAMEAEMYDSCYQWIAGELAKVQIPYIEMVRSGAELAKKNFSDYSVVFIGGGNTYKLLKELKECGAFEKLRTYLEQGGVAFGGSAGAIIFGEDLEACNLDDPNEVGLTDTAGMDVLKGVSLLCHFTSREKEEDARNKEYLLEISKHRRVLALPEEVTLFVNDGVVEVIGERPYYAFVNGRMLKQNGLSTIIFDFDYTMGDTTNGIVLSAQYALKQMGEEERTHDEIKKTIGLSLSETYKALTGNMDEARADRFFDLFKEKADEVMVDSAELYPGVKELLVSLRAQGYRIGIVTTKFAYRVRNIMKKFDAEDLLDVIIGVGDVTKVKPDPEGLLLAVKQLGVKIEEVLYVGDSYVDAEAAEAAGMKFAGVLTGTTTREEFLKYPCAYVEDTVTTLFERLFGEK